jgi:hypothetical protein
MRWKNFFHFERKKFSRLLRPQPQSADRKTSFALQLAEKHLMALVFFQNSVLLGLKVYFWALIFISYHLWLSAQYVVQYVIFSFMIKFYIKTNSFKLFHKQVIILSTIKLTHHTAVLRIRIRIRKNPKLFDGS